MKKRISIHYALTLLLSLFTILQVYNINFNGILISISSVILILLLPLCVLGINLSKIKFDLNTLLLLCYIIIHFFIIVLLNDSHNGAVLSTINFILVLFVLSIIVPNIYDRELGIKLIITISVISSLFLIIQFILLHAFDLYISGQVQFWNYRTSVMGHVRPFSFFNEPSSFGFYNAFGLATVLFCEDMNKKKRYIFLTIISFALLLSLSTTSIGLLLLVWAKWGVSRVKIKKVKISVFIWLTVLFALFLFLGLRLNIFYTIYEHSIKGLFSGNFAGGLTGRIGNLSYAWQYHSSIHKIFFGVGMVDLEHFIPAFARVYIYYGLLGYLVLGVFFVRLFTTTNKYYRTFILIALVSASFSDSIFGIQMLIYMPLVISNKTGIRRKNNNNILV